MLNKKLAAVSLREGLTQRLVLAQQLGCNREGIKMRDLDTLFSGLDDEA